MENSALRAQVILVKQNLVRCEVQNGKPQIPIPGSTTTIKTEVSEKATKTIETTGQPVKKENKKEKPNNATPPASEGPIDVGRLDFRVGRIIDVAKHPDADSLYVETIDCGEPKPRTVVSGLVKFVPIEEMRDRLVVILCNLKPAKMRGVTSEAMVMCASTEAKVEILSPPAGSVPGDLVQCDGYARNPDPILNPKKKIFETCAPDLTTNEKLEACFKGKPLQVLNKGYVVAQTLKNVKVK